MKKMLFILPILILSACNSNQPSNVQTSGSEIVDSSTIQYYEFDLNKNNLWYFIDSTPSESDNGSLRTLYYTFQGVLNYAYYENVVVHLDYDMSIYDSYSQTTSTHKAGIEFKLNASGSGVLSLPYDYVPNNAIPSISESTLYGFDRLLTIKSVSGKVKFSL